MTLMSSCLSHTVHLHRPLWGSYQDKDILALTLVLAQAVQPGSRVPLGVLLLPFLQCPPGLQQLSCHVRFKFVGQRLGFTLFINIPDIFKCQRSLVAFQNNAGIRGTQRLRPCRLDQSLSPGCLCQTPPPTSGMEGQESGTSPLLTPLPPDPLILTAEWGEQEGIQQGEQKVVEEKKKEGEGHCRIKTQKSIISPSPGPFLFKHQLPLLFWLLPGGLHNTLKELSRPGGHLHILSRLELLNLGFEKMDGKKSKSLFLTASN